MPARKGKLTKKEEAFVREFLVDLNQAAAARRAGFSAKSAKEVGHQLMQRPHVANAIQAAMDQRAKRTEIDADTVLKSIARIAKAAEDGEDWNAALRGQELLGKHLKLFTDKTELSGPNGGPIEIVSKEQRDAAVAAALRADS